MLLLLGWGWFALLMIVLVHGEPLPMDLAVNNMMLALRNPLADYPMTALASLGDWQILLPAITVAMAYLAWHKRWMAVLHWLAALALVWPSLAARQDHACRAAASRQQRLWLSVRCSHDRHHHLRLLCAVLIARELPGRNRVWPYMVTGALASLIGFARLYLGAHWLSDVLGGMLFGIFAPGTGDRLSATPHP